MVGQLISANIGAWDVGVSTSIRWLKNGVAIPNATGASYIIQVSDLDAVIALEVTGSKTGFNTQVLVSGALQIGAATLVLSPTPSLAGVPKFGNTLSVTAGQWDSGTTLSYQWLANGEAIARATNSSYALQLGDIGKSISIRVTGRKPGYTSAVRTSPAVAVTSGELQLSPVPTITGSGIFGSSLIGNLGAWDPGVTTTIQWMRDGLPIPNANNSAYKISIEDLSRTITIQVTGSKLGFESKLVSSVAITPKTATMTVKAPTLSGTVKVGSTITAKTIPWIAGATITYQWLLDGKSIAGATKSTYKILAAQKGKKISVKVTQSARGYNTASATSLAVKIP